MPGSQPKFIRTWLIPALLIGVLASSNSLHARSLWSWLGIIKSSCQASLASAKKNPDVAARDARPDLQYSVNTQGVSRVLVQNNEFLKELTFTARDRELMTKVLGDLGLGTMSALSWQSAINSAFEAIDNMYKLSAVEKGEMMAQIAFRIDAELIRSRPLNERRTLNYAFGLAVMRLEAYLPSEFEVVRNRDLGFDPDAENMVSLDRYVPYTLRYLEGDTKFVQGSLTSGSTIRNMEANNLFPAYVKHDMRHVHYAISHPRALSMIFSAGRSRNHLRYLLVAMAYEAVDIVQSSNERNTNRFLDSKGYDIEEGMTYLGRCTNKELEEIAAKVYLLDWNTKYVDYFPVTWSQASVYLADVEVEDMVTQFLGLKKSRNRQIRSALVYHRDPKQTNGKISGTPDASEEGKNF